jgi:hypothetical protein
VKHLFEARVDDGSPSNRKDPELDLDIKGVNKAIQRAFRNGRNGYVGHHSDRSPTTDHRIFGVCVATPTCKVFEGEVSFNVTFSMSATLGGNAGMIADAVVVRASEPS